MTIVGYTVLVVDERNVPTAQAAQTRSNAPAAYADSCVPIGHVVLCEVQPIVVVLIGADALESAATSEYLPVGHTVQDLSVVGVAAAE